MPIIEWNESFRLGVQQFDEHHQHLVKLLNRVYDDFTAGAPAENVGIILDELIDYATYHFTAEETWMRENAYPKLTEHCDKHNRFTSRVVEMQKDYHAGKLHMTIEVLSFINNWITNHILETDSKYGRFMATKGLPINLI
jgi:hemerythrin